MLRIFALLAIALLVCAPLVGCCGAPSAMPSVVLRSPVGLQMESTPEPMRVAPAYSMPSWSSPQVAPSYVPYSAPCAPPQPQYATPCR